MAEPPPPPPLPPGAPILLALLSLVGSGAPPGGGGQIYFQQDLPPREHPCCRRGYGPTPLQPLALVSWDAARRRPKAELARDVSRRLTRQPGANGSEEGGRRGRPVRKLAPLLAEIRAACRNHRARRFFRKQAEKKPSELQPLRRRRRAFLWPGRLPPSPKARSGNRNLVATTPAHRTSATSLLTGTKDAPDPSGPEGEGRLSAPPHPGPRVSPPAPSTEADRVAPATGCPCPGGDLRKAQGLLGKEAKGLPGRGGPRVPTPRTEEAAWAASALAFLLAVLTLAVLYARLHRKCRRGRSLYWTTAGEEGDDTVAAVLKRRLLSAQARRKKRPRHLQQRPLRSATSSDSSE